MDDHGRQMYPKTGSERLHEDIPDVERCVGCGAYEEPEYLVQCDDCEAWGHVACMVRVEGAFAEFYRCAECAQGYGA